jgi:hypothetical protein
MWCALLFTGQASSFGPEGEAVLIDLFSYPPYSPGLVQQTVQIVARCARTI